MDKMKPSDLSKEQMQTLFDLFDSDVKPKEVAQKTGIPYKTVMSVRKHQYFLRAGGFGSYAEYREDLARRRGFESPAEYREDWARGRGFRSYTEYTKYLVEKRFGSSAAYRKHLARRRKFESSAEYQRDWVHRRGFESHGEYRKHLNYSRSIDAIVSILHEKEASAKEISQEIKKKLGFSVKPSTIERKIRQFQSVGPWVNLDEETKKYKLDKEHWFVISMMQEIV